MLLLICTYRYKICLICKDISCHKNRICEKTCIYVIRMLCGFILELSHSWKLTELCGARQYPVKLCMGLDVALNKCNGLFRVNTAGKDKSISLKGVLSELCRLLTYSYSVHINNWIDAVVILLQLSPVWNSSDIIAQGKSTCRLYSTEYYLFVFFCHNKKSFPCTISKCKHIITMQCTE